MFILHPKALFEKSLHLALTISFLVTIVWLAPVEASWRVAPVKIVFDASSRSDVVTITNAGDTPLSFKVSVHKWLQDEDGQDKYQPTSDVVFFPKQLIVAPKSERVIRAGIKVPAVTSEKAFRLFIKNIPDQKQSNPNTVAISVRFGIPVFVKPIEEKITGTIADTNMANGKVSVRIKNLGNSHFRINSIIFNGQPDTGDLLFSQEITGGYLLQGSSRVFSTVIPHELCRQSKKIDIQVVADDIEFNGQIDVDSSMCPAL
jgi:fimbrial chaperone protein